MSRITLCDDHTNRGIVKNMVWFRLSEWATGKLSGASAVIALCLTGFAACSDNNGPAAIRQLDAGVGGKSGGTVTCPSDPTEQHQLAGMACDPEGARCLDPSPSDMSVRNFECNQGKWTLFEDDVVQSGGTSSTVAGAGGEVAVTPQGGAGGQGGARDVVGPGGVTGEGGVAGQGGVPVVEQAAGGAPQMDSASIVWLEVDQRPYTECATFKIGADYERDANGIPLKLYRGELYYNPTLIAQAGLEWLACYRQSGDEQYLDQARNAGHYLIGASEDFDGAMFFPYSIDFHLHSSDTEIAYAPWYSGMAQGQVLSLFSRLGDLTAEPEWGDAADATVKSFDRAAGQAEPWIVDVDENNSFWIEEYADSPEQHVLNGFMFGMFGLYDYYAWRGDDHTAQLFLQSLHTLRNNVELFRNPGDISAYCLPHRVQNIGYHAIHIMELHAISRMTGDPYFGSIGDLFADDYTPVP